jgi:ATP/maltotriose-dependent transcriptional regulator MalT
MTAMAELERGRAACARGAWAEADATLAAADAAGGLRGAGLDLRATAAYMLGREEDYQRHLERAHVAYLAEGNARAAARAAFWLSMDLLLGGHGARGSGWLGRAQRIVEREAGDCVERGYLLIPVGFAHQAAGRLEAGAETAGEAAAVAERFGDADLLAMALHLQGHLLVRAGRVREGLGRLDEAMVAVTAGETSPIASGIVYCGVIAGCRAAQEPARAQQWTEALSAWCARQPDMVAFSGRCHVHRAEILQLKGAWADALEEARCAGRRAAQGRHRRALGEAAYVQGEIHRLRGAWAAAEAAFRAASGHGREPLPGLALLRLAQGDGEAAAAAIRRVLGEATEGPARARVLPTAVEVALATGDLDAARAACEELEALAARHEVGVLAPLAEGARGALELAAGDARRALPALRRAWAAWEGIEAPYEAARARALISQACRALGDRDAAELEAAAARAAFARLGAGPDLERLAAAPDGQAPPDPFGLSPRERQVLRLLTTGRTNRAIAAELVVSERTVDRHVANLFVKLGVSSRAAATARAYEDALL